MFKNYLKIAFRNLVKQRVYSFINIAGLALGMACCILIFLWVQNEIEYDGFHKNNERLYMVINKMEGEWWSASPWALAPVLKKDFPEIEKTSRFYDQEVPVKYNDKTFYESVGFVDPDFLEIFSFPLLKGNSSSALVSMESVVISEETAQKYFGDENPMGKVIRVNKDLNLKVTGVIKNYSSSSSLSFDMLVPVKNLGEEVLETWSYESLAFVLLKNNSDLNSLKNKMAGISVKYDRRNENSSVVNSLYQFSRLHLYGIEGTGSILYVYIFSAVALIVLLVACINFINLFTAKSFIRRKEIGIRKVVGAGKRHIIIQFYGETFLLSVFAFGAALILAEVFLPAFNNLSDKQISLNFFSNPGLVISAAGIIILTTFFAGSYPALLLSSFRPVKALKETSSTVLRRSTIRWMLVIFQFVVSVILIVMTITMNRQFDYIQNKNLGFNREQVISLPLNEDFRNSYEVIRNQLLQHPGITHVTAANNSPVSIGSANPVYWEGRSPEQYEFMNYLSVDYDFFETFEMKIVEGRSFSKEFSTDRQNYIVNEAAVKHMSMKSPVGKLFSIWNNEGRIIGIVKDFNSQSLHNGIEPLVITMNAYMPLNQVFVRIKPGDMRAALAGIENIWKTYIPDQPFQYEFLDDAFRRQYTDEEKTKSLFQNFSTIAIFISCIGLFGLAAFTAQQRTKEIGIRKVAGASSIDITGMMVKDFFKWLIVAILIAVPVSYYIMNNWLQSFAYRTDLSWTIFAGASIVVLFIALLTVGYQAIKASRANPVDSLKYE